MKSLRERMDIVNAYAAVGTYRGAAALCGNDAQNRTEQNRIIKKGLFPFHLDATDSQPKRNERECSWSHVASLGTCIVHAKVRRELETHD